MSVQPFPLPEEEKLQSENEFLKMKIMLEHGTDVQFSGDSSDQTKNDLLKFVQALELHRANPVYITVYKKIGCPTHFKPVHEIADADMETALRELTEYMEKRGVGLTCCRPDVKASELYRFITEELFEEDIADLDMPDLVTSFIYDAFYPDPEYDNTQMATDDCIKMVLSKKLFPFSPHFEEDDLSLNEHTHISEDELLEIINRFKESYDDIRLLHVEVVSCFFGEDSCTVKGKYQAELIRDGQAMNVEDEWLVEFRYREEHEYWYMSNVQISGIEI